MNDDARLEQMLLIIVWDLTIQKQRLFSILRETRLWDLLRADWTRRRPAIIYLDTIYAFPYWKLQEWLGKTKHIASQWSLDLIDSFADLQWREASERTGEIPSFILVIAQVVLNRDIRVTF